MDNRGNGIDYIVEKSSIPEELKYIAEAQSKNTCDILKQKIMNDRKTIKIVGPCSKWVEGEGWVTEIPVRLIGEKVIIPEKITEETSPEVIVKIAKHNEKVRKAMTKEIIDKIDDMIGGKIIAQALKEIYEVEE